MKRPILAIWLVLITCSSFLLVYSCFYEMDIYTALVNFEFRITDVIIVKNSSGYITRLRIVANLTNPSSLSSFVFYSVDTLVFVNGTQLEYARGRKGTMTTIPPLSTLTLQWYYDIEQVDMKILQEVEASGSWNWFFVLRVHLVCSFVGSGLYDRSQSFEGVSIVTQEYCSLSS